MTWTARQTVDWFMARTTHWWGPNTGYVSPFTQDLGRPGEYGCADAVTDALLHAGIDIRHGCPGYCNCINLFNYMWSQPASGLLGFKSVDISAALPGDVVLFRMRGVWGHVGMIRSATTGNIFHTVENDTSSPEHPEWYGCGVCTPRDRRVSDWAGNLHVFRPTGYATVAATAQAAPAAGHGSSPFTAAQNAGLAKLLKCKGDVTSVAKALQHHLNAFHGGHLVEDGIIGQLSIAALQRVLTWCHPAAHLVADGVYGPLTSAALTAQIARNTI